MIFKKLIVPAFIAYTILVFLLAYIFLNNNTKSLESGIQLATYYATGIALFYGIFTFALMSIEYEIREIENRLNKFYRPADNFFESIKNRDFLEDRDRNRIKKLSQYKYLAKRRTKGAFKTVENIFLQNIPIDKNNNGIKKFLCCVTLDIAFYEKRQEECEELLHKFD